MVLFYLLLSLFSVYFQNVLFQLAGVRLDLLTLLVIFVSSHEKVIIATVLALLLGVMADCYGPLPLGLQAGVLLLAVVGVYTLRPFLNFQHILPQIVGVAAILVVQMLAMLTLINLLTPVEGFHQTFWRQLAVEAGTTVLGAPIILSSLNYLEKSWRRRFYI
ncbi:hypothetical protein [Desulfobacca acetoxidans]